LQLRRSFWDEISKNKRATFFLVLVMCLLLAAVAGGLVYYWAPEYWWLGSASAFFVALMYIAFFPKAGADWVLGISQARPALPNEQRVLLNVTHEMAIAAGVPVPRVYVIDDSAPNAFATGWNPSQGTICITTGLLRKLDRNELQGVIAHEMSHIRNYDTRLMMTLSLTVGLIVLLRDFFFRMTWFGGRSRSRDRDSGGNPVVMVLIIVLMILAPILAVLLNMAVSRKREFLADATAAQLTRYPDGLADALQKIEDDQEALEAANRATAPMYIVNPLTKLGALGDTDLFGTHPSTQERIRRLRAMGLQMGSGPSERQMPPMPDIPQFRRSD
jgi:heat shock protein HtpX